MGNDLSIELAAASLNEGDKFRPWAAVVVDHLVVVGDQRFHGQIRHGMMKASALQGLPGQLDVVWMDDCLRC